MKRVDRYMNNGKLTKEDRECAAIQAGDLASQVFIPTESWDYHEDR